MRRRARTATSTSGLRTARGRTPISTSCRRRSPTSCTHDPVGPPRTPGARGPTGAPRSTRPVRAPSGKGDAVGAYIVRRLIAMVLMLIALSMITFLLFNALPADPARLTCGKACTPQVVEANRHRLGLDTSLPEQYSAFVKGIFVGRTYGSGTQTFECDAPCLGYSFRKQAEVTDLIVDRLPVTGQLALGAFVIWIVVGVSVGVVAALKRGKWQDRTIMGAALTGYSFPSFFIALLLIFFVQLQLQLIPFVSYTSLVDDPVAWFQAFILPWVALAMLYAAFYARLTRNQMIETMGEDYIRTARAKGLKERTVIGKHGLRAGLT